jgi:hypothetical protein
VDVVGVEGELKDVAMAALNTRANFAYSLKEVCRRGEGAPPALPCPRLNLPPPNASAPASQPPLAPQLMQPPPTKPLPLQIREDMHRVFDTGYFSLCKPVAEETRDGIKLTLEVGGWGSGVEKTYGGRSVVPLQCLARPGSTI